MSLRRIQKEINEINKSEDKGFNLNFNEWDLFTWDATIIGPEGTPYEHGLFSLSIDFPKDYPFKPPKIKFTTKIFHPNIQIKSGNICCEIMPLGKEWSRSDHRKNINWNN